MRSRSVLWCTVGDVSVASSRVRAYELSDRLRDRGWDSTVVVGSGATGRLRVLRQLLWRRPAVVVLQKLLYDRLTLALVRRLSGTLVFECDDAVQLGYPGQPAARVRRSARRIARLRRLVDVVTTTNALLADDLRPASGRVLTFAGPAPPADPESAGDRERLVVWLGSPSTTRYLGLLGPLPHQLRAAGWRCVAIGAAPQARELGWQVVPWDPAGSADWLRRAAVGVLPQEPGAWDDRKAAYKALQYAAAGVVPVASDVAPARGLLSSIDAEDLLVADGGDWLAAVTDAGNSRERRTGDLRRLAESHSTDVAAERWENEMQQRSVPRDGLRVAMVCSQAPPVYGGAGTQAVGLAKALGVRGHAVDLYTQNQLRAPRSERIDDRLTIHRAPGEALARRLPSRMAEVVRTALFLGWLLVRLTTGRYEVLHLHGSYWFGVPAAIVARLRRLPLIVKVTRLGEDDARTVAGKRVGRLEIGWLYGLAFRRADVAIALSREIEARHREQYPDRRVVLLSNGVDVDRYQRALEARSERRRALGYGDEDFVVLFVGYLAPHKGVNVLLDAWSRFAGAHGDVRLLLVGPSSGFYRELEDAVSRRAQDESASSATVTVLNHVTFDEMPAIYAAADLFVLPTKAEGMPNSLLEALAAGLPAVASDVPGVAEISEHAATLETIWPVTADALSAALGRAFAVRGDADRRAGLPSEFGLSHVADVYAALYRELATARPGDRPEGARDPRR